MPATHFTGADGAVTIGGNPVTVVNFSIDVDRSVIASPRVGKTSDTNYAGKLGITGTISQVLVTAELLSYVLGDSNSLTTSSLETLLAAADLDAAAREELPITSDPTVPTSVKYTLTVGDVDVIAGSVVVHGTDSSDGYVTEVIDFAAMTVGDPAQVEYGTQQFKTSDYVDIEANLEKGSASFSTLKLEGVTGTKTMTPGEATLFDIVGKVEDADSNYAQITANNCFFTAGNFPIGDSDTLVECDLPFVITDPDDDLTLVWTST